MDSKIRTLRNKFRSSKCDNEAFELLKEINKLQRLRHSEVGSFLPHNDGKVYYYDLDYDRWMTYREEKTKCS